MWEHKEVLMFYMTWLPAIVVTVILTAIANKLSKGALYGMLQIAGMIVLAVIVVIYLSVFEFIGDKINSLTQTIEQWWRAILLITIVFVVVLGLIIWAWQFWLWMFGV